MGPKISQNFVRYGREFVINVIVITEFDCIKIILDTKLKYVSRISSKGKVPKLFCHLLEIFQSSLEFDLVILDIDSAHYFVCQIVSRLVCFKTEVRDVKKFGNPWSLANQFKVCKLFENIILRDIMLSIVRINLLMIDEADIDRLLIIIPLIYL